MSLKDNFRLGTCFMSSKENDIFGKPPQNKTTLKKSDLELEILFTRPY